MKHPPSIRANACERTRSLAASALMLAAVLVAASNEAAAQEHADWRFRASIYGYFPEINGNLHVPTPAGDAIDVDAQDLVDNLKFAAMGSLEAQKGRWGWFIDGIYMNVGDSISGAAALGQGSVPLPPGITADASLDVEATAITLAANYRAVDTANHTFDVLAGTRYLHAKGELDWRLDSPDGPLPPPLGEGRGEVSKDGWDAIVGFKGRHRFGARKAWFIPYYVDAGTGDSDFTWQAATGIGYTAGWGETFLVWRHLDYDFGRDRQIDDLQFSGPALGVAFSW